MHTIYTITVPTDAHKYTEISLYKKLSPAHFGEPLGHLDGCEIQELDTLKVYFTLEQAIQAQWGNRGIALLFLVKERLLDGGGSL